ncbi:TPA: hypothetical protein ACXAMQ_001337 [Klebsiella pneumoniae]
MSHMVYRHGDSAEWKGVGYDFLIVSDDELQDHLNAGWFEHPDGLLESSPDPEPEPEKAKKTLNAKPQPQTGSDNADALI